MSSMSHAFTKAFEAWEHEFRTHAEKFMNAEEIAATAVLPLSEQRTVCFEAILNRLAGGKPWNLIGHQKQGASR